MFNFLKSIKARSTLSIILAFVMVFGFLPFANIVDAETVELTEVVEKEVLNEQTASDTIDVILFNDFHGHVAEDIRDGRQIGMSKMVSYANEARKKNPNTIVVAGGDNYQGTAMSNLTYGKPVSTMMKAMDVVASAVGNHEFDWGVKYIETWAKDGDFEFLAANIYDTKTNEPVTWAKPYKFEEVAGVKIAFIGLAHPDTVTLTKAEFVSGLEFRDPVESAKEWVKFLQDGKASEGKPDVIMALTHIDSNQNKETKEITGNAVDLGVVEGLDAILSAHSHREVSGEVNGIPILQAYAHGRAIGIVSIELDAEGKAGKITSRVDETASSNKSDMIPDPETEKSFKELQENLEPILGEVIGHAAGEFTHNSRVTNVTLLGQWSSQVMKDETGVQIAIQNGGGLRQTLEKGPITMGHLYEIMPFDNTLVKLKMKGSDLKKAIDHGIDNPNVGNGQFAGLIVEYDKTREFEDKVIKMSLENGTPIEMDEYYTVVTNDFLLTGGDKYDFSNAKDVVDTYIPIRDVLVDAIKRDKTITPKAVTSLVDYVQEEIGIQYRAVKNLNLRTKSDEISSPVAYVAEGSKVTFLEEASNKSYFKVKYDGKEGFVDRGYVTSEANYTSSDKSIHARKLKQEFKNKTFKVVQGVSLRTGDENKFRSLTLMKKEQNVKYLGTTDKNWFKVSYNETVGYVYRGDVTSGFVGDDTIHNLPVTGANGKTFVAIVDLPIRTGNNNNYKPVTVLARGDKLIHLGVTDNNWFRVKDEKGNIGYVFRGDVTSQENYDNLHLDKKIAQLNIYQATLDLLSRAA